MSPIVACTGLATLQLGCFGPNAAATMWTGPVFSEPEIRSRVWSDSEGHRIELVDWSVMDVEHRGKLVLVSYGDKLSGTARCVDFYRPRPAPSPDSGQREQFVLLWHDNGPGVVTSISQIKESVEIKRRAFPKGSDHEIGLRYALHYQTDLSMEMDPSIGSWPIQ
jgi:hypothetical protein